MIEAVLIAGAVITLLVLFAYIAEIMYDAYINEVLEEYDLHHR